MRKRQRRPVAQEPQHRQLAALLQGAYAAVLAEPVPARLTALLEQLNGVSPAGKAND